MVSSGYGCCFPPLLSPADVFQVISAEVVCNRKFGSEWVFAGNQHWTIESKKNQLTVMENLTKKS